METQGGRLGEIDLSSLPTALLIENKASFDMLPRQHPALFDDRTDQAITAHCQANGVRSPVLGICPASDVTVIGPESREHLMVRGLNSRQRAVIEELYLYLAERGLGEADAKVYGHEAVTPLALCLRGRLPRYIGTEYAKDEATQARLFPILHGDICRSMFPDGVFNAVISCDVLEHVPSIDDALAETARVLVDGGRLIATFPFLYMYEHSVRLAAMQDGVIMHLTDSPIYHGNPVDPEGGSLVFELPGWDILARACKAGFSRAAMRFICDQDRGVVGSSLGAALRPKGVFVTVFDK